MNRSLLPAAALALLIALACQPDAKDASPTAGTPAASTEIAAEVNGEPITVSELDEWIKEDLFRAQAADPSELYDLRENALQRMVEIHVLETEAGRRGTDIDTLIEQQSAALGPITDTEVQTWYETNKARLGGSELAEIEPQIRSFLAQQRANEVRASLLEGTALIVHLEPPRIQVAASGPSKGPENASVTIIEFSDFECPYCSRVLPTLEQVMARYPEDVRLVYRNFPLRSHSRAGPAAEAALCAEEQGQFWTYHDKLFANARALSDEQLKSYAQELGLDMPAFEQCYDERRFAEQVETDVREGHAAGVTGTPAFFVNGVLLSGARPSADFYRAIDAELERRKEGA